MTAQKELGFWMCTALVVGNIIGMGIFMLPASLAPYGFNALLGWGITVLGMSVLARVLARLARDFPQADGPYDYIRLNVGDVAAFFAVWCYWVSVWITNAALAIGAVGYLGAVIPALKGAPPAIPALAMIWLFVAINLRGARSGGGVQVVTTALKLLPMLAIISLAAWVLLTDPAEYTRHPPPNPITFADLLAASTISLFAMLGIESATIPAGRVRDPERTIPHSKMAGTLVTAVIYVLVSAAAILLIPQAQLAKSTAPFVDLLDRFLGQANGRWLAAFVVVSGLGALNGWTLLVGELTRSMALQGVLPRRLARLNARGAPGLALCITGVLGSALVLMNYSKSLVQGFTFLTLVVTAANLPLYLMSAVALVCVWQRNRTTTVATTVSRDVLALGVLGTAYSIFAIAGLGGEPFLWSLVLGIAGFPIYFIMRRRVPGTTSASALDSSRSE